MKSQDLIPTLLSFLSPEWPAPVQTSAGDFLKAIITISANATQNDQSCIGPNSLTRQLVSKPCVERLIQSMLQGGNPLTVGVGIVIEVIRKNNSDYDPDNINSPDSLPSTYDPIYLGHLLRLFAKHIPDFMALIQSSKHTVNEGGTVKSVERGQLNSAWGAKIEPLGFDRFKTCELMAELLHCSNMGLLNEPGSEDYVRQRDAEREKLAQEGAFNQHREESSAFDANDSTVDFVNGSVMEPESPQETRTTEPAETGEDGFEDVNSSGVLVDQKDIADLKQGSTSQPVPSQGTTAETEKKTSAPDNQKEEDPKKTTDTVETHTPTSDPLSPSGLTHQIEEVSLDSPKTQTEAQPSAPMSSNPEAVPAPLFAAKPAPQSPDSSTPEAAAKPTEEATEEAPSQQDTKVLQQLHPDIQVDSNGQPVVGDYLKLMFVENRVVPTILVSCPFCDTTVTQIVNISS